MVVIRHFFSYETSRVNDNIFKLHLPQAKTIASLLIPHSHPGQRKNKRIVIKKKKKKFNHNSTAWQGSYLITASLTSAATLFQRMLEKNSFGFTLYPGGGKATVLLYYVPFRLLLFGTKCQ